MKENMKTGFNEFMEKMVKCNPWLLEAEPEPTEEDEILEMESEAILQVACERYYKEGAV
jgi:hypothetical protein